MYLIDGVALTTEQMRDDADSILATAPEFSPANLQATVDGSDVHLTWDPVTV